MIKYRLKFEFKKEDDPKLDRENHLNGLLSEIDSIVSDTPIRKPLENEIILISKEEYRVISVVVAFEKEEDPNCCIVYYDFVILLENKKNAEDRKAEIKSKEQREKVEDLLRQKLYKEKYKQYEKYQDPYKKFDNYRPFYISQ